MVREFVPQPFSTLMGVEVTEATKERVRAKLVVRPDLCTSGQILHGGAFMAFADMMGATGASLNLPEGAGTTTVESKTNFLGGAPVGTTIYGESLAFHNGRRTAVWQTKITNEAGKLLAVVTQTQLVLEPLPSKPRPV